MMNAVPRSNSPGPHHPVLRPASAKGIIFFTLEDETGWANLVLWPKVFDRFRRSAIGAPLLMIDGKLQREGLVNHVVVEEIMDISERLLTLHEHSPSRVPVLASANDTMRAATSPHDAMPNGRNFR